MTSEEGFNAFVQKVVTREVSAIPHDQHPSLDIFLDELAGELAEDARSRFAAHLATCPECQARWKTLKKTLQEEQVILESRARVPNLVELVQKRQPIGVGSQLRDWVYSLVHTPVLKPALALATTSLVAVAITLAVAIPLLRGPAVSTSEHLIALTSEVETLRNQVGALTNVWSSFPNNVVLAHEVTPEELLRYDWENLHPYTIQPGDQWTSIAAAELGNSDLWPLVWLMNAEAAKPGEPPPEGEQILLPTPIR